MRSNSYDGIVNSIPILKKLVNGKEDIILKSKDDGDREEFFKEQVQSFKEISLLSKVVQKQFDDLKSDYANKMINLAFYKAHLKQFKNLLEGESKIDNPNLKATEMAAEIQKFGV